MLIRNLSERLGRTLAFAFSMGLVCMMFSTIASAQAWNKRTKVTFDQAVEIPGNGAQVLPPGTYVFRLLDSNVNRNIVQISNEREDHVFATILAIPNYRLQATDKTVITFAERSAGAPPAIWAWFYPGDNMGQEFVYPKARAVELAKITNQPVLFMPTELSAIINEPITEPTAPPAVALREAPLQAVMPTGEEVPITEVVTAPPVQVAGLQETAGERETGLPRTASSLPLLALMGLFSVSVGLSVRALCGR